MTTMRDSFRCVFYALYPAQVALLDARNKGSLSMEEFKHGLKACRCVRADET